MFKRVLILSLALFCIFISHRTWACDPLSGDDWFILDLQFDQQFLPEGIGVIKENPGVYSIVNANAEPVYWVSRRDKDPNYEKMNYGFEYEENELPNIYLRHAKFLLNKRFWWDSKIVTEQRRWHDTYGSFYFPWDIDKGNWAMDAKTAIINFATKSPIEGCETFQTSADNRPNDVTIPKDQTCSFLIVYKGKEMQVPFSVKYALNNKYVPDVHKKSKEACNEWSKSITID